MIFPEGLEQLLNSRSFHEDNGGVRVGRETWHEGGFETPHRALTKFSQENRSKVPEDEPFPYTFQKVLRHLLETHFWFWRKTWATS